jgi:hypothetical protein
MLGTVFHLFFTLAWTGITGLTLVMPLLPGEERPSTGEALTQYLILGSGWITIAKAFIGCG